MVGLKKLQEETLKNIKSKSVYTVLSNLSKKINEKANTNVLQETKMLKAKSNRYKEENVVVGNTVFTFDKNGYMEIAEVNGTINDYNHLMAKNGIYFVEEEPVVIPSVSAEMPEVKTESSFTVTEVEEPVVAETTISLEDEVQEVAELLKAHEEEVALEVETATTVETKQNKKQKKASKENKGE